MSPRVTSRRVSAPPFPLFSQDTFCQKGAEIIKALAHPLRLRIAARLAASPATVGTLADELGIAQATVSQQLAILRARNLVGPARAGERGPYRILERRVRHMLNCLHGCIQERIRGERS
ncbi:MAG: winged helix-turn-helix transcriptional regulator [Myxococcales bacterium]|nr:winged helix-turn-helix transcriptional regulator [Myxococcales bacterium]